MVLPIPSPTFWGIFHKGRAEIRNGSIIPCEVIVLHQQAKGRRQVPARRPNNVGPVGYPGRGEEPALCCYTTSIFALARNCLAKFTRNCSYFCFCSSTFSCACTSWKLCLCAKVWALRRTMV